MDDHHQIRRGLLHHDAETRHLLRQARIGDGDAVLNEHLREIDVDARLEHDVDRHASVACRLRRDVEHVVDAIDLLLDGRGHGLGDHVRRRAGIGCADIHRRRRDFRIFGDGKRALRNRARKRQKHGKHRRKDRPLDEEVRNAHSVPDLDVYRSLTATGASLISPSLG